MNIHFIQHETYEAPGAYLKWAENRNYKISFSKVFEKDVLPDSIDFIDILIVMGGPQSPNTTIEECPHFNADAEIGLIQKCIAAGKAVVGVCLGSQLIGQALGANFNHSPEKEIGVFPITLTEDGKNDEKINHFGNILNVGHWHNDMPGLTKESKVLAFNEGCPIQIVSYSNLVYGFQCHMELNTEVVALLIESETDLLAKSEKFKFVQDPKTILDYDYTEMNEKLFQFLDKLVLVYKN
ncbi:GMP synthase (glutamine-hydrolyzing) [Flavobacterium nitrogenifigens]|uniref:GMP synthase (Glutamine-hydrolyzing) n=2 Tax=Flavobacterium TaxID=237 RepID=A0A7W7IZH6_9FLAO|nr:MULTISPECIES: type 1 glutamine amidotransferase [Flavobacterium]MBB4803441.1 GMP synthase (glutamine-hydrolyzing) [Flavobacterium nitrogenifigens]MBB6388754.1 GMP synthase (glutamine-hydrolyzing) [Flavobacterium notoginsengisoli]